MLHFILAQTQSRAKLRLTPTLGITHKVFPPACIMNTAASAHTTTPDADFFRVLEVARTQAIVARDMPTIERLHATDYELISPPGRVMTRERYLSLIAAEPFYSKWEHGPMRVRLSEGMAAVRYLAKLTFPSGNVVDCWHTDIYQLQEGSWKAIWSQATRLPQVSSGTTPAP